MDNYKILVHTICSFCSLLVLDCVRVSAVCDGCEPWRRVCDYVSMRCFSLLSYCLRVHSSVVTAAGAFGTVVTCSDDGAPALGTALHLFLNSLMLSLHPSTYP